MNFPLPYYIMAPGGIIDISDRIEVENKQEMEESINSIIDMLNVYDEVINFLIENKNDWTIEGEYIVFSNEQLNNQYNDLLLKL